MLRLILNKSLGQTVAVQPSTTHLENHPIRRTKHAGHSGRIKDELISDVLRRTLHTDEQGLGDQLEPILQQPCTDTGCGVEDLPGAMDDRDG